MAPPAAAKTARPAAAARHARNAARLRSAGESEVIETKIGAAEIELMTEKREENARNANCWSEGVSILSPHYPGSANRPEFLSRSPLKQEGERPEPLPSFAVFRAGSAPHEQESRS